MTAPKYGAQPWTCRCVGANAALGASVAAAQTLNRLFATALPSLSGISMRKNVHERCRIGMLRRMLLPAYCISVSCEGSSNCCCLLPRFGSQCGGAVQHDLRLRVLRQR